MRYLVFDPPRADWDFRTFDFDRDPPLLERWGRLANATDTDLREFRARGGKVLITYGWSDAILQPLMGVNYYEKAVAANGPDGDDFMRLFMIPGMAHCGGGLGPDQYDAVTAVVDWVEKGTAPAAVTATVRCAGFARRQQDRERRGDALAAAVPLPAGGALPRSGQHGRCGQLRMSDALTG